MTERDEIDEFLAGKRLAMVGVSPSGQHWSRILFRGLRARGYEIVPVRAGVAEIEGVPAYPTMHDVPGTLDGALLMVSPREAPELVDACIAAGIRRIWLDPGGLRGVSQVAVDRCAKAGVTAITKGSPLDRLRRGGTPRRGRTTLDWVLQQLHRQAS